MTKAAGKAQSTKKPRRRAYPRKNDIVLAAAEQAFLQSGFAGTSMDAIAEIAGVSKKTVYNNFANKEALFGEVIRKRCDEVIPTEVDPADMEVDPEEVLVKMATSFLSKIFTPEQIALYQTVVTDARQFPELGRLMLEGPILRSQTVFDKYLRQQVDAGRMKFPDVDLAAPQLVALLKTNVHMKLMMSQKVPLSRARIAKLARASVQLFLHGALLK
ncbi:TetR/AcrR family transcriptional regulator [Novosphingobium flavum]|uniref:TetR/AcrR family transcriptional regulator n=1 Tax=Novosphingobium aerophilum TaxID=2839843 RepID=UPI00163968C7|nr:TetR/AcrR family transcriptional regulator [Novosphingobium aerophilum]MBC2662789.1 TetR/AcrR family transcriptional regulator [Novosphingobium aerophilum]